MFDRGPTQLDSYALDGGREDATRKLMNRFKFGSESLLLTPFVAGVGKGAKALATRGKDLAYSNYRLERFLGKFAEAFTPEGALTKQVFGSQKVMEGFRSGDVNRATELIKKLDTNKRLIKSVADNFEVRNAKTIKIQANKKISFELLYDKKNSLYKKIKIEQARKETSNN